MKKQNFFFRLWFYFRQGWSTYFAFIFAAINTMTVTYFLAIENYPILQSIFPTFIQYVVIIAFIGVPILILVGYSHYKKTQAFQSEADIALEVNPYHARIVVNSELSLKINTLVLDLLSKTSFSDSLSDEEKQEIKKFRDELSELTTNRTILNKKDSLYFKKIEQDKKSND